jgi:hypothetical protein
MGCPDIIPTLRTQHCHKMGKKGVKWGVFFPSVAQKFCKTEYGLLAAHLFSRKAQKLSETRLVTEEELEYVMRKGDILFNEVMSGRIVMTYLEDYKELL